MKFSTMIVPASMLLIFGVPTTIAEEERDIPISEVPEYVLAAAETAVPGFQIEEAEIEFENGEEVYDLEGEVDGQEIEIEVNAAGQVLEIERDD